MEYRNLGKSGLKVSELSFGSWVTFNKQVDTNLAEKMFGTCLDAGINFFDNAEGYERGESEIVMGKALKALDKPRDSYCVSSKVFFGAKENPLPTQRGLSKSTLQRPVIRPCKDSKLIILTYTFVTELIQKLLLARRFGQCIIWLCKESSLLGHL